MSVNGRSKEIDAIDISKIIGNHVDVAAYIYDLEQIDRANRILNVLNSNYQSTFTEKPDIHSGFSKEMLEKMHIEYADYDTETALKSGRITFKEKGIKEEYIL